MRSEPCRNSATSGSALGRGGGLRPQVEIGGHDDGGVGPRRGERIRREGREGAREGVGPEVDDALRREGLEHLPRASRAVGIHRIARLRRDILGRGEDRARGADGPAAAIEPPEALAERVERRGLRHEGVDIEVDPDLDALRGDDDEAARGVARGAGAKRREHRGKAFALDGAGSADEEDPVAPVVERLERAAGEVHPVDDDGDRVRAGTVGIERGEQPARGVGAGVGKRTGAVPDRVVEGCGLRGAKPGPEYRMGAVAVGEGQPVLARCPGCRREERAFDACPPEGSDRFESLPEGLREVRLVEEEQRVGAEQSCVHREHSVRDSVAAKEDPRPRLVDRGAEDRRLGGGGRPVGLKGRASAEPRRGEGWGVRSCAGAKALRHGAEHGVGVGSSFERERDPLRVREGVVHDKPAIDDERGAKRCAGVEGEVEDGRVEGCGLARARRDVEDVGPALPAGEPLDERRLPRERLVAVDGAEERTEVPGFEGHGPARIARQRPSPA